MPTHAESTTASHGKSKAAAPSGKQDLTDSLYQFADNRPEAILQRKLGEIANGKTVQQAENNTGWPDQLKSGIENQLGHSMGHVKGYSNSFKLAHQQSHVYPQGTDVQVAPGQEKRLTHQAWHVVQQKQGRFPVTKQLKRKIDSNDNPALENEADSMSQKASDGGEALPPKDLKKGIVGHQIQRVSVIQLNDEEINLDDAYKTGDDWYANKDPESLSKTVKAKKKYQQLLYSFFDLTDQTALAEKVDAIDISAINSDFLATMISMHKHIAPFSGISGQGFDRTEQDEGSYVRSNTSHPLNALHEQLLQLKGRVPTSWIQPLNRALLELQAKTHDQANVDKLVLNESGSQVSTTRLSLPSAGLPANNMEILNRAIELASTRGTSKFYMINDPRRNQDRFGFIENPTVEDKGGNSYTAEGQGQGIINCSDDSLIGARKKIAIDKKNVQLNAGSKVQKGTGSFSITGQGTGIYQGGQLKHVQVEGDAQGSLMSDPGQTVDVALTDTRAASNQLLFNATSDVGISKSRRLSGDLNKHLERLEGPSFQHIIRANDPDTNAHDAFLKERAKVINAIAEKINGKVPGVKAIGSEDHPSLILHIPQKTIVGNKIQIFYGDQSFTNTKFAKTADVIPLMINEFNHGAGDDWQVKLTRRGSFGFQRPTLTDTGDSVRFWPGYAPIEVLTAGLTRILAKLEEGAHHSINDGVPFERAHQDFDIGSVSSDFDGGLSHLEGLKTAMRHTYVALKNPEPVAYPIENQERVARWLKIRMLIKLKQAETVVMAGNKLVTTKKGDPSANVTSGLERNFHLAADLVDKLQEYSFLYTAAVMPQTANPNQDHNQPGKFKDESDPFEKYLKKSLERIRGDHRVFYLDSGEQALVVAGLLANRFKQNATADDRDVQKSQYQDLDSYFEVGVFGGARRSNLEQDAEGDLVHADMSPVITSGDRMSQSDISGRIKGKWQSPDGNLNPEKRNVIPILDITNSSLSKIGALGAMPDNFILVESLTKHEQLGADKFIMGRLVAVSNTAGTSLGELNKDNFLDLAQTVVGPVANAAYNPVLQKLRGQMDEALYKKANPDQFALVLHPSASQQEMIERPTYRIAPEALEFLQMLNGRRLQDPWQQIMRRLAQQQIVMATSSPEVEDVD